MRLSCEPERSASSTRWPLRERSSAAAAPAGPAPITITLGFLRPIKYQGGGPGNIRQASFDLVEQKRYPSRARGDPMSTAVVAKGVKNTFGPDTIFRIHPAFGIARVGNSTSEFFIGPEIAGQGATGAADGVGTAAPPVTDSTGRITR